MSRHRQSLYEILQERTRLEIHLPASEPDLQELEPI
jgi:hypothetical protein